MAYVAAKNEPLSQRRRWLMNSGRASGTSVSATALLTYLSTQLELRFATSSKHRIR